MTFHNTHTFLQEKAKANSCYFFCSPHFTPGDPASCTLALTWSITHVVTHDRVSNLILHYQYNPRFIKKNLALKQVSCLKLALLFADVS